MLPGESLFSSWLNYIFLLALLVVGIAIYRIFSSIFKNHLKNNKKTRNTINNAVDRVHRLPHPIKTTSKVLGTIIYIAVCVIVIAYASN